MDVVETAAGTRPPSPHTVRAWEGFCKVEGLLTMHFWVVFHCRSRGEGRREGAGEEERQGQGWRQRDGGGRLEGGWRVLARDQPTHKGSWAPAVRFSHRPWKPLGTQCLRLCCVRNLFLFLSEHGFEQFKISERLHGNWVKLYLEENTAEILLNVGAKVRKQYLYTLKALSQALSSQEAQYDIYSMVVGTVVVLEVWCSHGARLTCGASSIPQPGYCSGVSVAHQCSQKRETGFPVCSRVPLCTILSRRVAGGVVWPFPAATVDQPVLSCPGPRPAPAQRPAGPGRHSEAGGPSVARVFSALLRDVSASLGHAHGRVHLD